MGLVRSAAVLAAGIALAASLAARADDYPSRPITLILPLGAGGAMDILARAQFEPKLKERLGKPIVIENRTGGGTVIAATAVAKARARRLHAVLGAGRHAHHQRHALQEAALRSGQGLHADRADLVGGLRAGGPSVAAGSFDERARPVREGAAGPAVVRLDRHRRDAASRLRDDDARRRPEDDPRALSRHAAGGERRGRQSRADGVRRSGRRAAADQGRQAAPARGVVADAHRLDAGRADHGGGRASRASRRCRGT